MTINKRVEDKPWVTFSDGDLDKLYNQKFPLEPRIDREGILLSSFFEPLIDRIIKQRIRQRLLLLGKFIADCGDGLFYSCCLSFTKR